MLLKKSVLAAAVAASICTLWAGQASATVTVKWTFDTNDASHTLNTSSSGSPYAKGTVLPNIIPDTVDYGAVDPALLTVVPYITGSHSNTATTTSYYAAAGNGTSKSLNATNWVIGDCYEINFGIATDSVQLSFDAISSKTGPANFKVQYSADGLNYSESGLSYTLIANDGDGIAWSSLTTSTGECSFSFDLSGFGPIYAIRLVDTTSTSAAGGTVATGGTSRLDNVVVSGDPVLAPIPEPATVSMVGAAVGALLLKRRR